MNLYIQQFTICIFLYASRCGKLSPLQIKGPKSYSDKIAIVGAGASGIDMALRLKQLGFNNVHIFEKEDRVGGKSWTLYHRGAVHEMGAVYLAPDYGDNIIELIKKYAPGDLIPLQPASVWLDNLSSPVTYERYVLTYAMNYMNVSNQTLAAVGMVKTVEKYILLHKELFGDYEGEIMPEPQPKILNRTRGTFLDFLKRNQLEMMTPLLYAANTMQGYGRLEDIACLYGLMWNTPNLMRGLLKRISGNINQTGLFIMKSGFGKLWTTIIKAESLNVTLNVEVLNVYRTQKSNYEEVWLKKKTNNQKMQWEKYDFLIWSPEMQTSLRYWKNPEIYDEQFYFNLTVPTFFTTALVDTHNAERGLTPIDYWFDNMNNKSRDGYLWAQRDSYASIRGYNGKAYQNGSFPSGDDGKNIRSTVTYQMSDRDPFYTELRHSIKTLLKEIGVNKTKVIKIKTWRFFPRFQPSDMEKAYLWRMLEMQGKYGMWYIGSSVCFESLKSVAEYNKLLLRKWKHIS